ncbi:acyltransferase family protein [Pseudomonas sp. NFX98]|uniref:acyltransferase family protein n=1 Tax=Pseudomonas sp. NFX98 TaxID=3399122 RepID=UPI0039FC14BD
MCQELYIYWTFFNVGTKIAATCRANGSANACNCSQQCPESSSQDEYFMIAATSNRSMGLQAIRGIAAFLVLLQHVFWLGSYFSSGPTTVLNSLLLGGSGVFLFFGLSGYLMAGQMNRAPKRFLVDRFRRIYPGLIFAFVVSGFALSYFSYNVWPEWTTVLLIPTGKADSIFIPYWTLIYEMQFYLLILLVGRLHAKYLNPAMLVWAAAILLFHSVPPAMVARASYPGFGEILFSFYNFYFITGIFVWQSSKRFPCKPSELVIGSAILFVATMINVFTEYGAVVYYYLAILAVFFVVRGGSVWCPKNFVSNFFVRLGDVSYGVYLIHISACFFTMLFVKELLGIKLGYWQGVIVIFIVGGSASYFFGFLELKLQEKLKFLGKSRTVESSVAAVAK